MLLNTRSLEQLINKIYVVKILRLLSEGQIIGSRDINKNTTHSCPAF